MTGFARLLSVSFLAVLLLGNACRSEPVILKLAFFASETEVNYARVIKPFIDAVNADARGAVKIEAYTNGALGKNVQQQPQMVLNGVADIAFVNPSLTPGRFPDDQLLELPGLFKDINEGTKLYEWLIANNALRGYSDFFVVGSFVNPSYTLFSRKVVKSVGDLRGIKVRIVGSVIGQTAKELGMVPVLMPPNEVVEAIGRGTVDAVTTFPAPLIDYGMARVTKYDFLLPVGAGPLAVLMNRKKFDEMPAAAREVILQYSGKWINERFIKEISAQNKALVSELASDASRVTITPSAGDMELAEKAYSAVVKQWASTSAENAQLLDKAQGFLADQRKTGSLK